MPDITEYELFRQTLVQSLGHKLTASNTELGTLWTHASDRQLSSWERGRVDVAKLVSAYADYTSKNEWHTAYLDWVLLDAMMYAVIYELIDMFLSQVTQGIFFRTYNVHLPTRLI